jgi:hypothetical protein
MDGVENKESSNTAARSWISEWVTIHSAFGVSYRVSWTV